jgi:hypothetical protein
MATTSMTAVYVHLLKMLSDSSQATGPAARLVPGQLLPAALPARPAPLDSPARRTYTLATIDARA